MENRGSHLTDIASIREWLHPRGPGPWWEQLGEVVEALSLEVGQAEMPVKHFVEWLVEWGREIRRRQTGLLLLTAHRAKGLEFDHVVVLDGGWEKIGKGEDRDAPRRLYYVAMSRAKQTLSLVRSSKAHPFLDALDTGSAPFIERAVPEGVHHDQTGLDRRYLRLTLKDVDIGFAGRFACDHAVHAAVAALKPDDALQLRANGSRWELLDRQGRSVGRLAKSFAPPRGMSLESIRVIAVIQRYRADSPAEYQSLIKCDQWEVIVPELVFGS
jgi:ATP-dependent DNA helicase RecQ